jgi:hypothetical protein
MSEKLMTLSLGGQDRTIDVGKFWFTKFYGQASGNDPLNSTEFVLSPEKQFDFVVNIVLAGLKTSYKVARKDEDFSRDDVENWIGEKENDEIVDIINQYAALSTVERGEAQAP